MKTLIIDTSTDKSLVTVADGKKVLLKIFLPPGAQSSRHLVQEIDGAFKKLQLSSLELEAVAVSVGPGSYTGIRVGVAVAKGLAFPRSLPLVGFCSLQGFISPHEGTFASLIDARIGGAYVLLQERKQGSILPLLAPRFVSNEELPGYLQNYPQVGPHTHYPDADHLARITAYKLATPPFSPLEILYLRTPQYTSSAEKKS